jgi:PAS domain-containing protein
MKQPRTKPAPSPRADRAPRQRAGQRLKRPPARAGEAPTQEATARLLHELQVHQVELEMQHEQLTAARAEVAAGRARYADLYDFAPTAYLTLDREGAIRQTNLAGARLLGGERAGRREPAT